MSNKILLTGGAGFIGARLAAALAAKGHELDIVDNLSRGVNDAALDALRATGKVRFHQVDLLTHNALGAFGDDYEFVIHFAAIVGVQNVQERPYQTLRDNVVLHEAAIAFASRQKKLQRLIFTSTSEIYAGSVIHMNPPFPTPEDTPLALPSLAAPRTSYMLSKIYGEAMLIHSGCPYTIVRPHNVYGPRMGMSHVIPQLLEKVHKAKDGGAIEVFSPDHQRTFCYIDDGIEMVTRLMRCPAALNQVVNLGSETPEYTMREVARIVVAATGKALRLDEMPPTPGSPVRRTPKMDRMTALIGYKAQTSLADGVRQTYEWYRKNVFS